jgi:Spy/CpxP family protein refolding chaperone
MKMRFVVLIGVLLLGVTLSEAFPASRVHEKEVSQRQAGPDPFDENLFSPELILQNQEAIGLTEEQKVFFKSEVRKAQTRFTELQWALQDEMEKLQASVKPAQVDESQTLMQLDKLLNLEREIKKTQIGLLVRFKNRLTPDQQAQLREIQHKSGAK